MNVALGSNPQDTGIVAGQVFSPFATNLAFGGLSDYQQIGNITPGAPTVTAPLASRDTGSGPLWAQGTFNNLSDTGVYTLFVIGIPGQTGTPRPSLLLCADWPGELRPESLSRAHSGSASIGPPARMSDSFTFSALNFSAARVSFSTVASNSSGAARAWASRSAGS
jgi:hypothetical protein